MELVSYFSLKQTDNSKTISLGPTSNIFNIVVFQK